MSLRLPRRPDTTTEMMAMVAPMVAPTTVATDGVPHSAAPGGVLGDGVGVPPFAGGRHGPVRATRSLRECRSRRTSVTSPRSVSRSRCIEEHRSALRFHGAAQLVQALVQPAPLRHHHRHQLWRSPRHSQAAPSSTGAPASSRSPAPTIPSDRSTLTGRQAMRRNVVLLRTNLYGYYDR